MHLLVLNAGSASLKHALFEVRGGALAEVDRGHGPPGSVGAVLGGVPRRPDAVAHRIVHGGTRFAAPVRIDAEVLEGLRAVVPLAPLHMPAAIAAIEACGTLPMAAVFDTAFHRTLPEEAWRLPIPRAVADPHGLRAYGFHGISHQSVLAQYAAFVGRPAPTLVTLHLGGGSSAAAIRDGRCVDTSMTFSPRGGMVMGSRTGDLDPGVLLHLLRGGMPVDALDDVLSRASGLVGLAGTSDMRALLGRDDPEAKLAVEMYCRSAVRWTGAYLALLGGAEAIVFTGGIGENAPEIRRRIASAFGWAGLRLNEGAQGPRLTRADSRLAAYVFPSDEERLIAREALPVLLGEPS